MSLHVKNYRKKIIVLKYNFQKLWQRLIQLWLKIRQLWLNINRLVINMMNFIWFMKVWQKVKINGKIICHKLKV
jgi:hypothetical protein